jgi:hypothetical protein
MFILCFPSHICADVHEKIDLFVQNRTTQISRKKKPNLYVDLCFDHVSAVFHHIQVSFSAAESRQGDLEIWERGVHVAENRQGGE